MVGRAKDMAFRPVKSIEYSHIPQLVTITVCLVHPLFLDQKLRCPGRETGRFLTGFHVQSGVPRHPPTSPIPLRQALLEAFL